MRFTPVTLLPADRAVPNRPPVIRVSELQRKQLLSSLGLNQTQLQQLAGLLGNDHIKHIAKDKLQQLREANPGQHVVSVLAKQVLQLQPALGGPSSSAAATANGFVAAFGPVLPEVKSLVAAAVKAVGGGAAEPAPAEGKATGKPAAADADATAAGTNGAASEAAAENAAAAAADGAAAPAAAAVASASNNRGSIDPIVSRLVSRAVAKVVTAAEQGLDLEDLTEADLDAFLEGEEFEVSHAPAEDEEAADEHADGQAGGAGAATGAAAAAAAAADSSPAASAASQVERCKRAMQQYSLKGAAAPVSAGSGDRWLLLKRHTLMKSVGLEDMSKTPAHVLLQPLRLAVYAQLGLSSVTEYMCLIDEQWRSWANGRAVEVPPPPKREKRGSKKGGRGGGGAAAASADGSVHPAVKKLVAAAFAKILGTDKPAAEEGAEAADDATEPPKADGASSAAADDAGKPAAEEEDKPAAAAAEGESSAGDTAAAPAAGEAAAEEDDGIDPVVRKLVSAAIAKAVTAANRAASRANKSSLPYEQLPKVLPQKPTELASLLLRRLRALDKSEQQFSKTHEKLLMLQVRCHSCCCWIDVVVWLARC